MWGGDEDEHVEIAEFDETGETGSIIAYIGSAEVELPVGTTDCHLTFGSGDTKIDIGPFKVVREA